jgi:hypothetical protein
MTVFLSLPSAFPPVRRFNASQLSKSLEAERLGAFKMSLLLQARAALIYEYAPLSRKSATIFGQGTIPEPSTSHICQGVALDAPTAVLVYIYARDSVQSITITLT